MSVRFKVPCYPISLEAIHIRAPARARAYALHCTQTHMPSSSTLFSFIFDFVCANILFFVEHQHEFICYVLRFIQYWMFSFRFLVFLPFVKFKHEQRVPQKSSPKIGNYYAIPRLLSIFSIRALSISIIVIRLSYFVTHMTHNSNAMVLFIIEKRKNSDSLYGTNFYFHHKHRDILEP